MSSQNLLSKGFMAALISGETVEVQAGNKINKTFNLVLIWNLLFVVVVHLFSKWFTDRKSNCITSYAGFITVKIIYENIHNISRN